MWGPGRRGAPSSGRRGLVLPGVPLGVLLGALASAGVGPSQAAGLTTSCHIHPPTELVERGEQPVTIGPYASNSACESERLALFGDFGRCHCVQTFAPRSGVGRTPGMDRPDLPGATRDPGPPLPPLP